MLVYFSVRRAYTPTGLKKRRTTPERTEDSAKLKVLNTPRAIDVAAKVNQKQAPLSASLGLGGKRRNLRDRNKSDKKTANRYHGHASVKESTRARKCPNN